MVSVPTEVHGVEGDNGKSLGIPDTKRTSESRRASPKQQMFRSQASLGVS